MNTAQHPSTFLHNPTHAHTHAFGFINVYWCLTFEFHSLNMIAGPCGLEGNEKKGHTFMFAISQKIIMFYHFIWMSLTVEEFRNTNPVGRKMKANEKCDHVCICVNNTHGLISGFLFLSFIDTWAWEKRASTTAKHEIFTILLQRHKVFFSFLLASQTKKSKHKKPWHFLWSNEFRFCIKNRTHSHLIYLASSTHEIQAHIDSDTVFCFKDNICDSFAHNSIWWCDFHIEGSWREAIQAINYDSMMESNSVRFGLNFVHGSVRT